MEGKVVFLNFLTKRKLFKTRKKVFALKHGDFGHDIDSNFSFEVKIEDVEKITVNILMTNGSGEKEVVASQKMVTGMHFGFSYELNGLQYKFEFIFK